MRWPRLDVAEQLLRFALAILITAIGEGGLRRLDLVAGSVGFAGKDNLLRQLIECN